MSELVRPKKPPKVAKAAETAFTHNDESSTRPTVVQGFRFPDVPAHHPSKIVRPEPSASPEPEEQVLSDVEEENPSSSDRMLPRRAAPLPPSVVRTPPPLPPRNLIFPRSKSVQSAEASVEAASIEPSSSNVARYPTVPELAELPAYSAVVEPPPPYSFREAGLAHSQSVNAIPQKIRSGVALAEAPSLYPAIEDLVFERDRHGLLTEAELLHFYHNPLYEAADQFVDNFVEAQELPNESGPLFKLLKRLKALCEQMVISQINEKENTEALQVCLRECWQIQQQFVDTRGKCLENNDGSGRGGYQSTVAQRERIEELRKLLTANRSNLLDHMLCEESMFRSIALQVQWEVIVINNQFMSHNHLNVQSAPCLVETSAKSPMHTTLRNALSDLFYFLRFPRMPKRFSETLIQWASELVSVLNMRQSCEDGIFLLSHLLRLPSPHGEWSAPLVQTFVQSPTPAKMKVDYCLALLSHMLIPIKGREKFLRHVAQSEKDESSWAILGNDDVDEQEEFSFVTLNETDLTTLFDQIPISELYSIAYLHVSSSSSDKASQFVSLVAFQLLLMKILDNGLTTYARPGYKMFCKQIGNSLRQSVREICVHWQLAKNMLRPSEADQLQKEVDRVVLLALNYLVNRDSGGLWQFIVDLPYDSVSEECRNRCEMVLRSTKKLTIHEIYETPLSEVVSACKAMRLKARADVLGPQDAVFLVNSLAAIAATSVADMTSFLKEIIDVCFCEDSSREVLYKVGGEAIGQLLARRPSALDQLLSIIDRNLQHMDNYAINVLSSAQLSECRISHPILIILGKWLINNPPEHAANRLARRVLSSLYWGPAADGSTLWLDADTHSICAETVVKAHSVHCSRSNGMIAKSVRQITKLASKVGDAETHFQQFCWDILVKLKLSHSINASFSVQNDLTAHYVQIVQSYEESVETYLDKAIPLLSDLVQSGSAVACIVLISRFIARHYTKVDVFFGEKTWLDVFERILHVDQLSYALQWLSGPSSTPTPIVRLISSGISYYSSRLDSTRDFIRSWVQLLCSKRNDWNEDQVTYQILGTVVRIAFINDPKHLFGIPELLQEVYMQKLETARDTNRGLLSVFSGDRPPPPLVPTSMFGVAPFATYLMLLVEQKAFRSFYNHFFDALGKKEKLTLEAAVKKAANKSSQALPLLRLSVFRWAEFVGFCKDSAVLPLVLQQLSIEVFSLRTANGKPTLFSRRLLDDPQATPLMESLKSSLESATVETKGLARAVSGWIFSKHDVMRTGFDFSVFDLDYLLQLIISGDLNIWMDFLNMADFNSEEFNEQKLYASTCHLNPKIASTNHLRLNMSSPRMISTARGFPTLPKHPGLPQAPSVEVSLLMQHHAVSKLAEPFLKSLNSLANQYVAGNDKISSDDSSYHELVSVLYTPVQQTIPVEIRCGMSCRQPRNTTVQVQPHVFSQTVDAQMTSNREKRAVVWNELTSGVTDKAAVATASLEHLASLIARLAASCPSQQRNSAQLTGRNLLYLMTSSVGDNELLFPVASESYQQSLFALAEEFVRFRPEEQLPVMRLVLDGFVLSDPLIESFTPEVLSPNDLCSVYTTLSESVRLPERSQRALKLLARLGMEQTAANLPAHQFSSLLPIAFANLASQPDSAAQLHVLCLQHVVFFVFHHFPSNFPAGLQLALDGCNTNSTPTSLLRTFVDRLGAANFTQVKPDYQLGAEKALQCAGILTEKLVEARKRLPAMYSVWARYFDSLTRLAQLFLYVPVRNDFRPTAPIYELQSDLSNVFSRVVALFSPVIAPFTPSQPPFSPSHEADAVLALERFTELLNSLPHNSVIPPGMQNLQSLVWQYYHEKISNLTHGTAHYYGVIERQFANLNWNCLWPSPRGLEAMEECLWNRSVDCAPFVGQMVVRVPWKNIISTQVPELQRPSYLATLLSVLVRLISKQSNYTTFRATLLELFKSLSARTDWSTVSAEQADNLARIVSSCLPSDALSNPVDLVAVFQIIWRKVCGFTPRETYSAEVLIKQVTWLRTECSLLLKCDVAAAPAAYNSLISDVNSVASQHSNLRSFCAVTRELNAFWTNIPDERFGEALVKVWTEYISANVTSPLVLTSLNTLVGSLSLDQLTTALKLLEKTLHVYFHRPEASWAELVQWINFPLATLKSVQSYLICVPTSENKVHTLMLTLRVFLDCTPQSDEVFFALHNYVISLKPKHISDEPAFVAVLARLLQWSARRFPSLPATLPLREDLLPPLIRWLGKSSKDDSSFFTTLISSKKTAHSPKLRILMQILELYLTQQTLGEGKRPRCDPNAPVLNSRIQTLRDLSNTKANQSMAPAFNAATVFFVQIDIHNISSAHRLLISAATNTFHDHMTTANGFNIPVLDIQTIVNHLAFLEVDVCADDIKNPRPQKVQIIFRAFCIKVFEIEESKLTHLPLTLELPSGFDPELHARSSPLAILYAILSCLMDFSGGKLSITMCDLINPEPRQIRQLMSLLADFSIFLGTANEVFRTTSSEFENQRVELENKTEKIQQLEQRKQEMLFEREATKRREHELLSKRDEKNQTQSERLSSEIVSSPERVTREMRENKLKIKETSENRNTARNELEHLRQCGDRFKVFENAMELMEKDIKVVCGEKEELKSLREEREVFEHEHSETLRQLDQLKLTNKASEATAEDAREAHKAAFASHEQRKEDLQHRAHDLKNEIQSMNSKQPAISSETEKKRRELHAMKNEKSRVTRAVHEEISEYVNKSEIFAQKYEKKKIEYAEMVKTFEDAVMSLKYALCRPIEESSIRDISCTFDNV
ncbi:unnamed protein product [Caenorhabditis auriculariae]|uniref:Ectopic P granules protein 5 homolog n=1 Tax=Caenorhabditis auriculariae TaxID=2777116 RepID=A0A8S1HHS8_9PELO|nr:unnamed protein product [Caenorhabditis auriculariae]